MTGPYHCQPLIEGRSWRKLGQVAFELVGQQPILGLLPILVEHKFRHDRTTESREVIIVGKNVEADDLFQCQFIPPKCQTAIAQPCSEGVHVFGTDVHIEDLLRALGEPAVEDCLVVCREPAEQGFVDVDEGFTKKAGMWYADSHSLRIVFTDLPFQKSACHLVVMETLCDADLFSVPAAQNHRRRWSLERRRMFRGARLVERVLRKSSSNVSDFHDV